MSSRNTPTIASLRHWLSRFQPNPSPDADLLRRFAELRDESAFAALLDIHGPMVLGVARRIVGDHHIAEDVFQATFLVLVRKAGRIRRPAALTAWLHRTAHNIALTALRAGHRRERAEVAARTCATGSPLDDLSSRELLGILDAELQRLPEKLRLPLILCCLEGRSQDEAARLLGWTAGAVKGRLERCRLRLRDQLTRRGITFAIGAGVVLMVASPSIAGVREATLQAIHAGASASAAVSTLLQGALKPVFSHTLKILVGVAAIALLAGGAALALLSDFLNHEPNRELAPVGVDQDKAALGDPQAAKPLPQEAAVRLGAGRFRSEGQVQALLYSPNGKMLVGQTESGVILWDAATGQEIRRLPVRHVLFSNRFSSLAVSPDGTTLAVTEPAERFFDTQISVWDMQSGKKTRILLLPEGSKKPGPLLGNKQRNRLFFTADGKSLVTLAGIQSGDGKPVVLDIASGEVRSSLRSEGTSCYNFTVSSDGKTLAAAVDPKAVQIWDIATGKLIRTVQQAPAKRPLDIIHELAFAPDGKTLTFVVSDGSIMGNGIVRVDLATGKEFSTSVEASGNFTDLAITPDGTKLIFGFKRPVVQVRDVATGKILQALGERDFRSIANTGSGTMALSPDGKTVAHGGTQSVLTIWDVATGKELFAENKGHKTRISSVAFSPDGKKLLSADDSLQIHAWNVTNSQDTGILPRSADSLSYSPDGKQVALIAVNEDKSATRIRFWDLAAAQETLVITVPDTQVLRSATFAPAGLRIFTLDWNSSRQSQYYVRHWDVATGKQEHEWTIPHRDVEPGKKLGPKYSPQPTLALTLASDGKTVFAAENNWGVSVYDVDLGRKRLFTGAPPATVVAPRKALASPKLLALAASPDSRMVAAARGEPLGQFVNQNVGKENAHSGSTIHIGEVATAKEILVLKGHRGPVSQLAWSPDGRLLASGDQRTSLIYDVSGAQTVRLWDVATGNEVARYGDLKADVTALMFTPDGKSLGAGLSDGSILIWDLGKVDLKLAAPSKLSNDVLESRWRELAGDDATRAHQAIWTLAAAPQESVPFLKGRLQPAPILDAAKIRQWIIDQDSETFAVRQTAAKELEKADTQAQTAIQKAIKENISLEARLRLEQILNALDTPRPEVLAAIRAIVVLEMIGSREAVAILNALAKGAPGARTTEQAQGALGRLINRAAPAL